MGNNLFNVVRYLLAELERLQNMYEGADMKNAMIEGEVAAIQDETNATINTLSTEKKALEEELIIKAVEIEDISEVVKQKRVEIAELKEKLAKASPVITIIDISDQTYEVNLKELKILYNNHKHWNLLLIKENAELKEKGAGKCECHKKIQSLDGQYKNILSKNNNLERKLANLKDQLHQEKRYSRRMRDFFKKDCGKCGFSDICDEKPSQCIDTFDKKERKRKS